MGRGASGPGRSVLSVYTPPWGTWVSGWPFSGDVCGVWREPGRAAGVGWGSRRRSHSRPEARPLPWASAGRRRRRRRRGGPSRRGGSGRPGPGPRPPPSRPAGRVRARRGRGRGRAGRVRRMDLRPLRRRVEGRRTAFGLSPATGRTACEETVAARPAQRPRLTRCPVSPPYRKKTPPPLLSRLTGPSCPTEARPRPVYNMKSPPFSIALYSSRQHSSYLPPSLSPSLSHLHFPPPASLPLPLSPVALRPSACRPLLSCLSLSFAH